MAANAVTELLAAGAADACALLGERAVLYRRGVQLATVQVVVSPAESEMVFSAGGAQLRMKATAAIAKAQLGALQLKEGDLLELPASGSRFYIVELSTSTYDPQFHATLAN